MQWIIYGANLSSVESVTFVVLNLQC